MATKRDILQTLTRQFLLDLAGSLELSGLTGRSKDQVVDALIQARSLRLEQIMPHLSRDQLKAACRELGLSDAGREKQVLIDRLLGKETGEVVQNNRRKPAGNPRASKDLPLEDLRHATKRKNNPPAGIAAEGRQPKLPRVEYSYSARRPPVLRWDVAGKADRIPKLISVARERPLTQDEATVLTDALRTHEPWLEWAGKREEHQRGAFAIEPVALHIHERVSAQAVLRVAARQDIVRDLFADPEQVYHEAVQFYKHEVHWANRLILGDSLQVMASLSRREDLAGKVQMIYVDPPYGITFRSNFQPTIANTSVSDRERDLSRETEVVRAYRDTWELGTHSYLSYMRDRLIAARELLADTGSIFVQISDENLHRVRALSDETFGPLNFVVQISITKKGSQSGDFVPPVNEYVLWYCKDKGLALSKFRRLFLLRSEQGDDDFPYAELRTGEVVTAEEGGGVEEARVFSSNALFSQKPGPNDSVLLRGRAYPSGGNSWKIAPARVPLLDKIGRALLTENRVRFKRYQDDFPAVAISNVWTDLAGTPDKRYVVQTNPRIVERCMLMTTDPGDLVLDPTCGSGTTASVAEQWGRRWITIDTSRVAISIARQRLLTSKYDYYRLRTITAADQQKNPQGAWLRDPNKEIPGPVTFQCRTVPHITLRTIAQNTNLAPICDRYDRLLRDHLTTCNRALSSVNDVIRQRLAAQLAEKQKSEGKRGITDADRRRWILPKKGGKWEEWEVPFDTDPHWPKDLQQAVREYRTTWRAKMDEVNACIAANAEREELVDQPEIVRNVLRVSGPFTVESVQPPEGSLGHVEERDDELAFGGDQQELPDRFSLSDVESQQQNVQAYLDQMLRLLRADGVRFPDNRQMRFSRLHPLTDAPGLHGDGRWHLEGHKDDDPEGSATVAVALGPQYGPVTALQVEELIRTASRRGYDELVVAGFSFDAEAQTTIENASHPRLRISMAHIRPDVNPGMEGLLKEQPGSQLFTVFGRPRTNVKSTRDGYVVKLEGVDIYDPVTNTISASGASKVAAWFIDGDYDGRTFCITQAFFPNRDAWDKLARALSSSNVIDASVFEALSGTESLPFPAGKHKRVAIKVIDPRGNEVMQIHGLE
jgi:adenine-specific DNA-methyltransferase